MVKEKLRIQISEINPDALIFDNPSFDNSIIGISSTGRVIYDLEKMVEELSEEDNMQEEDARDFIDFNTLRTIPYIGENSPIVLENLL